MFSPPQLPNPPLRSDELAKKKCEKCKKRKAKFQTRRGPDYEPFYLTCEECHAEVLKVIMQSNGEETFDNLKYGVP